MDKEYHCPHCKKQYSSYKSLWNHNKNIHRSKNNEHQSNINLSSIQDKSKVNQVSISEIPKTYKCRHCNNEYKYIQSRHKHEKTCNVKIEKENEKQAKLEIQLAKEDAKRAREEARVRKEKNEEIRLKLRLENAKKKTDIKTKPSVNKINQLLKQHNEIKNSTVNSHNNITNNNLTIENQQNHQHQHNNLTIENQQIIQNYQIIQVGKEQDIHLLLTNQEKMTILRSRRFSLRTIVEMLHCGSGKYKQFRSVIITNLRNKYVYKYDAEKREFITATMEDVMALIVDSRLSDLETIYDQNIGKIDELSKKSLNRFINEMREPGSDSRHLEIEQIKMLLFNDRDKIMSDIEEEISLVLTVVEVPDVVEYISE